jgi:hypothetical protein
MKRGGREEKQEEEGRKDGRPEDAVAKGIHEVDVLLIQPEYR